MPDRNSLQRTIDAAIDNGDYIFILNRRQADVLMALLDESTHFPQSNQLVIHADLQSVRCLSGLLGTAATYFPTRAVVDSRQVPSAIDAESEGR